MFLGNRDRRDETATRAWAGRRCHRCSLAWHRQPDRGGRRHPPADRRGRAGTSREGEADRAALRGVGIGFGGPVDDATQTVIKSHQIAGWDGFPLADWVSDLVGVPAVLGNDADVAGLAEALFGAGKGLSPIFYITVGTGSRRRAHHRRRDLPRRRARGGGDRAS